MRFLFAGLAAAALVVIALESRHDKRPSHAVYRTYVMVPSGRLDLTVQQRGHKVTVGVRRADPRLKVAREPGAKLPEPSVSLRGGGRTIVVAYAGVEQTVDPRTQKRHTGLAEPLYSDHQVNVQECAPFQVRGRFAAGQRPCTVLADTAPYAAGLSLGWARPGRQWLIVKPNAAGPLSVPGRGRVTGADGPNVTVDGKGGIKTVGDSEAFDVAAGGQHTVELSFLLRFAGRARPTVARSATRF